MRVCSLGLVLTALLSALGQDTPSCPGAPPFVGVCHDRLDVLGVGSCSNWQSTGYCTQQDLCLSVAPLCALTCGYCQVTPTPPPQQPSEVEGECVDSAGFIDARGYRCTDWVGYNCDTAESHGYSFADAQAIVSMCPATCNRCEGSTSGAVLQTGETIDGAPGSDPDVACADRPDYLDNFGNPCTLWEGWDCSAAVDWGYSTAQHQELLVRCPMACDQCPCVDDDLYASNNNRCGDWATLNCSAGVDDFGLSQTGTFPVCARHASKLCFRAAAGH